MIAIAVSIIVRTSDLLAAIPATQDRLALLGERMIETRCGYDHRADLRPSADLPATHGSIYPLREDDRGHHSQPIWAVANLLRKRPLRRLKSSMSISPSYPLASPPWPHGPYRSC